MKTEDNKHLSVENLISIAIDQQVPPLYNTIEVDGIIVKEYCFIRGNKEVVNGKDNIPAINIQSSNLDVLTGRKNEIESQIELHQRHCISSYKAMLFDTRIWLEGKFNHLLDLRGVNDAEMQKLQRFVFAIHTMLSWIMVGAEKETALDMLKDEYPPFEILYQNNTTRFDIYEFADNIKNPVDRIHRIVLRTAPLYLEYLKIQSVLCDIDVDRLIEALESKNKLSTADSRIKFVEGFYFKNDGSQNPDYDWDDAVKDAKKEDSRIPYKNGNSFLNSRRNLKKRQQNKRR